MRVSKLLCLSLALCVTGAAQAIEQVWFQAVPVTPGAEVVVQGAPGVSTVLNCPPPIQRCEWDVTVMLTLGANPNTLGYSLNLFRNDPDLEVKTFNFITPPYAPIVQPTLNDGDMLVNRATAGSSSDVPASPPAVPLNMFRLSKDKTPGGPATYLVHAGIGVDDWGQDDGNAALVRFGVNAPIEGFGGTNAPLPVISITNIPEPATLGLLSIGLIGFIRRRAR
jgi:hypothetical protein